MVTTRVRTGPLVCGFCQSGNCNHCPRGVRNGNGSIIPCACSKPYCGGQVIRCLECKNENEGEVSPDDWRCLDREACELAVRKRLDGNVHVQRVREVMRRVSEQTTVDKAEKAEKAPKKETFCIHCGERTGGGLFRPGHDAKYVATQVRAVVDEGSTTAEAVLAEMRERGASETLQAKFTHSVELARKDRERRQKLAAEAEEKARAKADAATQKAAEKAARDVKQGEEPVAVAPDTDPEKVEETPTPKTEKTSARKLTASSGKK